MAKSWSEYYNTVAKFTGPQVPLSEVMHPHVEVEVDEFNSSAISRPYGMWLKHREELLLGQYKPLANLEVAMAKLREERVLEEMNELPKAKTRRGKKNPEDRKPKGVPGRLKKGDPKVEAKQAQWQVETEMLQGQNELLKEATKLLESYAMRIQVLEVQVDELRALVAKVEELDDRVNWLET